MNNIWKPSKKVRNIEKLKVVSVKDTVVRESYGTYETLKTGDRD